MKAILKTAGGFYFFALFYIFFLARRRPGPTFYKHILPHNLVPLRSKIHGLMYFSEMTSLDKWNFCTDLFGNIGLFIPMPFFLMMVFNIKSPVKLLLIAMAISAVVEISQYILSIGVADIDDLILNTMGACTGLVVIKLLSGPRFPYLQLYGRNK